MTFPTAALASLADVSVAFAPPPLDDLPDAELMDVSRLASEIRRRADAVAVLAAAELKRRSAPELGHNGLAQRLGARTPEKLVQRLTGVTKREAGELIRVGEITATPTRGASPDLPSWLSAVGSAVRSGSLSVAAADAIHIGLGAPCEGVPAEQLARARRLWSHCLRRSRSNSSPRRLVRCATNSTKRASPTGPSACVTCGICDSLPGPTA